MTWERSGVPGAGTSWATRDVPGMWQAIENQQSDDHWRLVSGWRKTYELTWAHLRRLETYRASLVDVWPPDRNAAAAAYVRRLDFLIENVRQTYEVAAANYTTLSATVGALASARLELKPLYDEYVGKAQAAREYEELVAFSSGSEGAAVVGPAPVTRQELERLNQRARAIMYSLSHTLVEAEAAIKHPPTYQSRTGLAPADPDVYGTGPRSTSDSSGAVETPPLAGGSSTVGRRSPARPSLVIVPAASLQPRPTGPSLRPLEPDVPLPGTAGSGRPRPLPTGGVIGGPPSLGPTPNPRKPARANPIGGVIAGTISPSAQRLGSPGSHQAGTQPLYGMLGGRPPEQRQAEARRAHYQDPDPWKVAEGGPPVIVPPPQVHHFDPGPAMGLDR
ncbi:hypothetical protein [Phytohabitans rumicis]|uniref:hypothetical protein n=1 Tax=Phytohabitans rumicis TaxID=1076125 RepID=UPI0031F0DE9A